jgi:3-methyladenine DNA glycosylase AlkD
MNTVVKELRKYSSKEKAKFFPRFFKAGKGQYAEGDIFIGVTVPYCRLVAKKNQSISLANIKDLLKSKIHEVRLTALIILTKQYNKANLANKQKIFNFYLQNTKHINNWDLVDLSASKIVGEYILYNPTVKYKGKVLQAINLLTYLAKSENLWEKRIAIIATFAFIKSGETKPTLLIAKTLLKDKHDLIHKAVGWMLREVGKNNKNVLVLFLKENYYEISRTTLRYAIEKFPDSERKKYLTGKINTINESIH